MARYIPSAFELSDGYILYQDNKRVVIATGCGKETSENPKTGNAIQIWILATERNPVDIVRTGDDSLICGDCRHAGNFSVRTCYVNVLFAPSQVWKRWERSGYGYLPRARYADVFSGRIVRFGAYGDPAYIPLEVLRWVAFFADGHTGYTHQWRNNPHLAPYLMASVDSEAEYRQATSENWRTFRVRGAHEALAAREIICPASNEGGHKTQCAKCRLCDGNPRANDGRKDIAIIAHGMMAKLHYKPAPQLIQIGGAL